MTNQSGEDGREPAAEDTGNSPGHQPRRLEVDALTLCPADGAAGSPGEQTGGRRLHVLSSAWCGLAVPQHSR